MITRSFLTSLFALRSASRHLSTTLTMTTKHLVVDPFCYRQFAEHQVDYSGTVLDISVSDFERIVNERFDAAALKDGYAPFCKHLFLVNDFTDARGNVLEITKANEGALQSRYEARNDQELPVLTRHFVRELLPSGTDVPVAAYLDLILYSRAQIHQENDAQGRQVNPETAPWGIVSIKAQDVDYELPMNPITIMRNSLGKAEGGSGVPLDREAYMESVNYWKNHAVVN